MRRKPFQKKKTFFSLFPSIFLSSRDASAHARLYIIIVTTNPMAASPDPVELDGETLDINKLYAISVGRAAVTIKEECFVEMKKSEDVVAELVKEDKVRVCDTHTQAKQSKSFFDRLLLFSLSLSLSDCLWSDHRIRTHGSQGCPSEPRE